MNYALSLLKEIIKKRKLVWDLGKADFRKRFVGSYFRYCVDVHPAGSYHCDLCSYLWYRL